MLIKLLFFSVISTKQTSQKKKKCCCQQAQEMGLKGLLFSADEWCVEHRSVQSPSWGEFIIPRTMEEGMSVQFYQCSCRQTDGGMDFCWFSWLVMEKAQRGAASQQYMGQWCDTHLFYVSYSNIHKLNVAHTEYFLNTPHL